MNVKHKKGIIAECYAKAWLLEREKRIIENTERMRNYETKKLKPNE